MQDDEDATLDGGDDVADDDIAQYVGTTDATQGGGEDEVKADEHELEELEEARQERMELM